MPKMVEFYKVVLVLLIQAYFIGYVLYGRGAKEKVNCDNISEECYESSRYLPIDVVYTWVNGSDPLLQENIEMYKSLFNYPSQKPNNTVIQKLNIFTGRSLLNVESKKAFKEGDVDAAESPFEAPKECPIDGCITAPAVVSVSPVSADAFTLDELTKFIGFTNAVEVKYAVPENYGETLMFVKFPSIENANLAAGKVITSSSQTIKFKPLFYSFQHGEGSYVKTSSMLVDISSCNLNNVNDIVGVLSYDPVQRMVCMDKNSLWHLQQACRGVQPKETYLVWPPWAKYTIGRLSSSDVGAHRFADNEELKYSLRSLILFAPWVRNIHILTNGQIPKWLNIEHPRIKIVTHEEVFQNNSHLPTFSSPAIEANLHNIPGISEHFLYFNDDVFLGRSVYPEDFISTEGYKVFLAWNIPNCNSGCPPNWLTDGYCDLACNVSACNFDGGDCLHGLQSVANMANNIMMNAQPGAMSYALTYCNPGCSPSWVGDKYCDPACNVEKCGFDAGDCGTKNIKAKTFEVHLSNFVNSSTIDVPLSIVAMYFNVTLNSSVVTAAKYQTIEGTAIRTSVLSLPHKILSFTFFPNKTESIVISFQLDNQESFIAKLNVNTLPSSEPYVKPIASDTKLGDSHVNEKWSIPDMENIVIDTDLTGQIDEIIGNVDIQRISANAQQEHERLIKQVQDGLLTMKGKWIKLGHFIAQEEDLREKLPVRRIQYDIFDTIPKRHLLDSFADSLHYVNNLYTNKFGKTQRKVLSHMPFLINTTILSDLHSRFPIQFNKTSSNRFRSSDDMQFAFSYYYYVIHATHRPSVSDFLSNVDINKDDKLNDGELTIMMTRLFDLPVSDFNRSLFDNVLSNCSKIVGTPIFTIQNIIQCPNITVLIERSLKNMTTYPHVIIDDKDVTFKMLKSNHTKVQRDLDYIRSKPKKFICLNDNMDHTSYGHYENAQMLRGFYQTMFPYPSPFEHPAGVSNNFLYKFQYTKQSEVYINTCFFVVCLFSGILLSACYVKKRLVKKLFNGILFRFFK